MKFRHYIDGGFFLRCLLVIVPMIVAAREGIGVLGILVVALAGYGVGWILDEIVFAILTADPDRVRRFYREGEEMRKKRRDKDKNKWRRK